MARMLRGSDVMEAASDLEPGAIVQDYDGDRWTLMTDGKWRVMPVSEHHGQGWTLEEIRAQFPPVEVISEGLAD